MRVHQIHPQLPNLPCTRIGGVGKINRMAQLPTCDSMRRPFNYLETRCVSFVCLGLTGHLEVKSTQQHWLLFTGSGPGPAFRG